MTRFEIYFTLRRVYAAHALNQSMSRNASRCTICASIAILIATDLYKREHTLTSTALSASEQAVVDAVSASQ